MTENLFAGLARHLGELESTKSTFINAALPRFTGPFRQLDFIPELELALKRQLPQLHEPDAKERLSALLADLCIDMPERLSLPQIVDKLAAMYLEPQCIEPTFIINPPECLSPLAKSFEHNTTVRRAKQISGTWTKLTWRLSSGACLPLGAGAQA